MIQVRELSKRFGTNVAVDRLDFSVEKGEILGFLGPNGAGKTTTMRILTGFFPPTSGSASINGHNVVADPMAARASVGYLPENVPLYVDMRVGEYLKFVAGIKGLDAGKARHEVDRVLKSVDITGRKGQLIKQLSKGFRQRVGLAQALLADPPVLILDEPTIGLDPGQIVEIRSLIKSFANDKTVVLSSHILPEVAATCSKVVIINQGRLVAQGPPSLLAPGAGAGGGRLRVVAQGPAQLLAELLSKVQGVAACSMEDAAGGDATCGFTLDTTGGNEVQAEVAKAVVGSGHDLIELSPVTASLEEVFMQLTTNEAANGEAAA
jgi:ABC-2 type transport system ATP-binding protein